MKLRGSIQEEPTAGPGLLTTVEFFPVGQESEALSGSVLQWINLAQYIYTPSFQAYVDCINQFLTFNTSFLIICQSNDVKTTTLRETSTSFFWCSRASRDCSKKLGTLVYRKEDRSQKCDRTGFTWSSIINWANRSRFSKLPEPQVSQYKAGNNNNSMNLPTRENQVNPVFQLTICSPSNLTWSPRRQKGKCKRHSAPRTTSKWKANQLGRWPALTHWPLGMSSYLQKHTHTHTHKLCEKNFQYYFFFEE